MDLEKILKKLEDTETEHYSDPIKFCDDMWLIFENAWLYYEPNSKNYNYATMVF